MRFKLKYCLIFLFLPAVVSAHGLVTTQSQTVGDYRIEFEYNTLGDIYAGDYTIYDTYLLHAADGSPADFDSSFIRIQKQNGPAIMAGSLAESMDNKGYASISGMINDPGAYMAELDFYKSGQQLAKAQYSFNVIAPDLGPQPKPTKNNNLLLPMGLFLLGIVIGIRGAIWIKSRKKI